MAQEITTSIGKNILIALLFTLLSAFIIGMLYLSTVELVEDQVGSTPYASWLLIAYAAGLSMIILPCTLPMVFIIVPLCMGKGYKKGLSIAVLFGIGLVITITAYGIAVALLGQYTGIDQATRVMWFFAGAISFTFGLSELKLLNLQLPSYAGTPKFIEKRGDKLKPLLMGLLLGNAGVGCPNPFFYFMLTYIIGTGSVVVGGSLGLIHGIGRAVPLIFIAILAILGISATQTLVKKRVAVEKATGFGLLAVGAFILLLGLFGHSWWELSPMHLAWNEVMPLFGIEPELTMGAHVIMPIPWTMLVLLIVIPAIGYWVKEKYGK
jgi:cytochrome c-type biogenesis protein